LSAYRILGIVAFVGCTVAVPQLAAKAVAATTATPATAEVAVLARPVLRGDLLSAADFTSELRPTAQGRGALAASDAAGRESVRNMPAGSVVRSSDVVAPRLVRRGEPVNIVVKSGGLTISTQGRALASGGAGDLVRVVAASTNRTLDGIVDGSGAVRIGAP
jgi:flagella basal body P-ring formation protein FlgA